MKILINFARVFVGVLFIFSGLVKANDPLGLGYKMQEFFEIWNQSLARGSFFLNHTLINIFDFFHDHSLALAVIMIAFEIIAGVALLLGWRMKLFGWLLLLLIIFFTFLTGYAVLSGKFKNCGCFGDCLPITPMTSFMKDLILLVLIGFLFTQRKKIKPLFSNRTTNIAMLLATILSFGIQSYALTYLPFVDCLPYKVNKNIPRQMQMPGNAIQDSVVITFVYEKAGQKVEFTADKFPADFNSDTYKFISRYDKVVRKGSNNEPPIKSFILSGVTDQDSTAIILAEPYAILVFCENFSTPVSKWEKGFSEVYRLAKQKNISAYIITTQPADAAKKLTGTAFSDIPVMKCDYTAIRTAARTNPCIYIIKQGTIQGKWSYKRMSSVKKAVEKL